MSLASALGCLFTAVSGFVSAWLTTHVRSAGLSGWYMPLTAVLPCMSWTYFVRFTSTPLPLATMLFEVTLCSSTLVALTAFGVKMNLVQGAGAGLAILGLALLARG